jgi:hypothetical protein
MSKTKKKIGTVLGIPVTSRPHKPKKSNPAAFQKGNKFAFKAGEGSPCPGGKPHAVDHLFSKNVPLILGARAPDETCRLLKLPIRSSISQCILQRAALDAFSSSDPTVRADARSWLLQVTGELKMGFNLSFGDPDAQRPVPKLVFLESDGNGGIREQDLLLFPDLRKTIEGERPALPAPEVSD